MMREHIGYSGTRGHPGPAHIVGVDGCRGGWIAVTFPINEPRRAEAKAFESFASLVEALPGDSLIAVDTPIGLPDRVETGGRPPDRAARKYLGKRGACVFPVPSRKAVYAFEKGGKDNYAEVCAVARATSDRPAAPSKQCYQILSKIREIDALLLEDSALRGRVFEVHPEVSFAMMNEKLPVQEPKKRKGRAYEPGMRRRAELLNGRGFPIESLIDRWRQDGMTKRVGLDDLLDACTCAWSAGRIAEGTARSFPEKPGTDSKGLQVAIRA